MSRGICPVCGFSFAITKKGILLRHHNTRLRERSRMCLGVGRSADTDEQAKYFAPPAASRETQP